MRELSLHLLDLVENSLEAGASLIDVRITEDVARNRLIIEVDDDGRGMEPDVATRVVDPFYTTRTTRSVGMGIPLLMAAAQRCAGDLWVSSRSGEGTRVRAEFQRDHIDRAPMGDLRGTLMGILLSNRASDVRFTYTMGGRTFTLDTRELRDALGNVPLSHPTIRAWLDQYIGEGLTGLAE